MLARFVLGAVTASAVIAPALAGQMMNAEEARKFVAGKVFAFICFDGTRGAGRVLDDGGATGAVQFSGSGPVRHMRLPGNTLQVRGQSVCASIKGIPFEPCFNLDKMDDKSFRGSVSGMGFAYCDFRHQGVGHMLMARAISRPRSLAAPEATLTALTFTVAVLSATVGVTVTGATSILDINSINTTLAAGTRLLKTSILDFV